MDEYQYRVGAATTTGKGLYPLSICLLASILPRALTAIADLALKRGTGARGLRAILEEGLLDTMYELPGRADVAKIVIEASTVTDKAPPTLVPRASVRSTRPRRAAS